MGKVVERQGRPVEQRSNGVGWGRLPGERASRQRKGPTAEAPFVNSGGLGCRRGVRLEEIGKEPFVLLAEEAPEIL